MAKALTAPQAKSISRPRTAAFSKWLRSSITPRVILIIMCALYLLPFYSMITVALKSNTELTQFPPTWIPHHLEWSNFSNAVNFIPFWRYMANTAIITFFTFLGAVISNPIAAYGFSRIEWPGRDKVFMVALASVFVPFPVIIVALFDIFAKLHWVNTFLPLIVPMWFGQAFWIFLMRQFFMQVSYEMSDAAKIDGASEFRIFWQIIMPQTLPALGVISILAIISAWNDFIGPLIYLQSDQKYTLAIGLVTFSSASTHNVQFNLLMAASTLVVVPVIILFLLFQRSFIEGISMGSVK